MLTLIKGSGAPRVEQIADALQKAGIDHTRRIRVITDHDGDQYLTAWRETENFTLESRRYYIHKKASAHQICEEANAAIREIGLIP